MSKNTISVTTTLGSPRVSKAGFGTLLILMDAEDTVFSARTKKYASLEEFAVDFPTTTDPEYKAIEKIFLQKNPPPFFKVGRIEAADENITATLNAIIAEDADWYFLASMSNLQADVTAIATWTEANKKFFATCDDDKSATTAAAIAALGYDRTLCMYHSTADRSATDVFADIALVARMAITTPGSTTWYEKDVVGVTADILSSAEIAALEAKNVTYFVDVAGNTLPYEGKVASGEWADVIRFADWLAEEIAYRTMVLKLKKSYTNTKIPYTSSGITMVEAEIAGACNTGVINGGLASYTITSPDIADVSTEDKTNRVLNNMKVDGVLAGGILYVNIAVTLEV